jgi:hypothetical protein
MDPKALVDRYLSAPVRTANTVVQTIADQMGGVRRLKAFLGATFVGAVDPNTLGIKFPNKQRSKGNYVEVEYMRGSDDYVVRFYNLSNTDKKEVKVIRGAYAEDLVRIFEQQTGWYLRM